MRRPELEELDLAADLLWRLTDEHGLSSLRLGSEPGELVADVAVDRTYFDVVAFEDDSRGSAWVAASGRCLGCPAGVSAGAPHPRRVSDSRLATARAELQGALQTLDDLAALVAEGERAFASSVDRRARVRYRTPRTTLRRTRV
jgi:hypothetical protein